ncbi:unnamed protein product [Ambrosiozyma monospora]|uniref:Unnamed protein product n=1 Tax=Ambrosiozyma monospora TaxID=43982 RepID=A0ACB5SSL7_AMBMO|nr:unnamed protein product [Ambrosiozyma monospora]
MGYSSRTVNSSLDVWLTLESGTEIVSIQSQDSSTANCNKTIQIFYDQTLVSYMEEQQQKPEADHQRFMESLSCTQVHNQHLFKEDNSKPDTAVNCAHNLFLANNQSRHSNIEGPKPVLIHAKQQKPATNAIDQQNLFLCHSNLEGPQSTFIYGEQLKIATIVTGKQHLFLQTTESVIQISKVQNSAFAMSVFNTDVYPMLISMIKVNVFVQTMCTSFYRELLPNMHDQS